MGIDGLVQNGEERGSEHYSNCKLIFPSTSVYSKQKPIILVLNLYFNFPFSPSGLEKLQEKRKNCFSMKKDQLGVV